MDATVSVKLEDFDKIREAAENYELLRNGLDGYMMYLFDQKANKDNPKPLKDMIFWKKQYNETNPKHPF